MAKRLTASLRRWLDRLYLASGVLAATFVVAIVVIVLLQVAANLLGFLTGSLAGTVVAPVIPSYAELAGFFLAAASFLALAHALREGTHIRVSLVLQRLPPAARHLAEIWCLAVGTVLAGYFAWYTVRLVQESWHYGDVSPGMLPVPLWLPQSAMAAGLVVLTVALLDELVGALRGRSPVYRRSEDRHGGA